MPVSPNSNIKASNIECYKGYFTYRCYRYRTWK